MTVKKRTPPFLEKKTASPSDREKARSNELGDSVGGSQESTLIRKIREKFGTPLESAESDAKKAAVDLRGRRAVMELRADRLVHNIRALRELSGQLEILPMVKANAYGHGAQWVSRILAQQTGICGLGVASLEEGREVRRSLKDSQRTLRVVVFSGASPWTEEVGQFCEAYGLSPVLYTEEDFLSFLRQGWQKRLSYELKFNTGMNRLGFGMGFLSRVKRELEKMPAEHHPAGVMTHLACGDQPEHALTRHQLDHYSVIRRELANAAPSARYSLGASSALWNQKQFRLSEISDHVRLGLSLYGVPPWKGAPLRGILPVMTVKAQVLQKRALKSGDLVGYDGAFRVTQGSFAQHMAVLGLGYADGVNRHLSGKSQDGGYVWLGGREERVLGRVSMDLTSVSCSASVEVGDWAEWVGDHVDHWAQAENAGTIPYDLLTCWSDRVERITN